MTNFQRLISGQKFYNPNNGGNPENWAFMKGGRIYTRQFIESTPDGATSPITVDKIDDSFAVCSNMFWEEVQLLDINNLKFI